MITIKAITLFLTIAVFVFTYAMAGNPGFRVRSFAMLASAFVMMGVPMLIMMFMSLVRGQWPGVFFLCGMISAFAIGAVLGYAYSIVAVKDEFAMMMIGGLVSIPLAGTPLAMYLLP
jgi:hypothetical protein